MGPHAWQWISGTQAFSPPAPKEARGSASSVGLCPFPMVLSMINRVTGQPHCLLGLLQRQCGSAGGHQLAYRWCAWGACLDIPDAAPEGLYPDWLLCLGCLCPKSHTAHTLASFFIFTQKLPNEVSLTIPSTMLTFPPPPIFCFSFPGLFFFLHLP